MLVGLCIAVLVVMEAFLGLYVSLFSSPWVSGSKNSPSQVVLAVKACLLSTMLLTWGSALCHAGARGPKGAFTPRDVLSRIHAALKEPPAKLAAVIVSQSEQIKALGREYADVAELVTMAHEVAGAPPGGRASVSTVKIILYRPGPATRLPNGSEGIPTQFILRRTGRDALVLH
ncbi:hypothetical protein AK812_SmicGene45317 [Symbiodinium microadriaticum]|uniref:Uncharacterized protein n=1 Tax=Symbiodinium microadriaticum TaxID=2951 RepID=A0A1Q9BWB2_SYMMI|nr:hypothetical protein AK812_SmicGene45317 [Symbiodinium microadriaticum]